MKVEYCLDSDVIIWLLRNEPRSQKVAAHVKELAGRGTLACCALTVMEVEQGMRPTEEQRTRSLLRSLQVHTFDQALAEQAAELVRSMRSRGVTMGLADAVIAATSLAQGATLVTLNVRDFEQVPDLAWETIP